MRTGTLVALALTAHTLVGVAAGQAVEPGTAVLRHDQQVAERLAQRTLTGPRAEQRADASFELLRDSIASLRTVDAVVAGSAGAPLSVRLRLIDEIVQELGADALFSVIDMAVRDADVRERAVEVIRGFMTPDVPIDVVAGVGVWLTEGTAEDQTAAADLALRLGITELIPIMSSALVETVQTRSIRDRFDPSSMDLALFSRGCSLGRSGQFSPIIGNLGGGFEIALVPRVLDPDPGRSGIGFTETLVGVRNASSGVTYFVNQYTVTGGVLVNTVSEPDLRFATEEGAELVVMEGEQRLGFRPGVQESLVELARQMDPKAPDLGYDERAWFDWYLEQIERLTNEADGSNTESD